MYIPRPATSPLNILLRSNIKLLSANIYEYNLIYYLRHFYLLREQKEYFYYFFDFVSIVIEVK